MPQVPKSKYHGTVCSKYRIQFTTIIITESTDDTFFTNYKT